MAFFLGLALVATRPLARDLRHQTLAGPDPLIDLWTVHWLSGHFLDPRELFGGNIFHPTPHAVLFSDLSLGTAILLVPLRALIDDPVPLYNLGLLLALAMGGWSFCTLARDLTGSLSAGLLAGVLASFGSHQLSHVYHLNLLTIGWIALYLLGLHRLVRRPGWGSAVLTGVSASLTAQSSGYFAVAAAVLGIVFVAVHFRDLGSRRVAAFLAGAAVVALALTAPYMTAFHRVRQREGLSRSAESSSDMAFQPSRDLTSHSYLYRKVLGSGGQRLFPGVVALVLSVYAVYARRPGSGFYAAATVVLLLLSLGPAVEVAGTTVPLPYAWLFRIPPFDSMRHPYTFAAVGTFTLSVLAGLGWAGTRLAGRALSCAAMIAVAVVETLAPAVDVVRTPSGVPPVYELLETLPPGPVLEVPVVSADTLLWAARHGRPVVNGTGAFVPHNVATLHRRVRNHWIRRVPANVDTSKPTAFLVERLPVRYLIVPAGRNPQVRPLAEALERSRIFERITEAADGDRLYEVRPAR